MSFMFGGNSSKSKSSGTFSGTDNTTTDSTGTQTSTPMNPDWVTNGASGMFAGAQKLAGANPQNYVAGPDGLQTDAAATAWGLNPNPTGYTQAGDFDHLLMTQGKAAQTSAVQASPFIQQYMDPYTQSVVDATMKDFDNNAGQTRAQQDLTLAHSGAFGGSGAAITQSLTEGQLARARATQDAQLRSSGFSQALSAAQQDAQRAQAANDFNAQQHAAMQDRRLQAGRDLTATTTAQGANERANIGTQMDTGGALQKISQAQATAPLELQSWLQQYFSGLPTNLFHGQTDTAEQHQTGTEDQSGTQSSTGSSSGLNFGFKVGK